MDLQGGNKTADNTVVIDADHIDMDGSIGLYNVNATTLETLPGHPGDLVYNTTTGHPSIYNGTTWVDVGSGEGYLPLTGGIISGNLGINTEPTCELDVGGDAKVSGNVGSSTITTTSITCANLQVGGNDYKTGLVETVGNQTIGGTKTFSSSVGIQPVSNQIILGGASGTNTTTITAPSPGASRVYTIPDAGSNASFLMSSGTKSISGSVTFNNGFTAADNITISGGKVAYFTNTGNYLGGYSPATAWTTPINGFIAAFKNDMLFGTSDTNNSGAIMRINCPNTVSPKSTVTISSSPVDGSALAAGTKTLNVNGTGGFSDELTASKGVVFGSSTGTTAGTIHYDGSNFQGYNGTKWVGLDTPSFSSVCYPAINGSATAITTGPFRQYKLIKFDFKGGSGGAPTFAAAYGPWQQTGDPYLESGNVLDIVCERVANGSGTVYINYWSSNDKCWHIQHSLGIGTISLKLFKFDGTTFNWVDLAAGDLIMDIVIEGAGLT